MSPFRFFIYSLAVAVVLFLNSSMADHPEYRQKPEDGLPNTVDARKMDSVSTWEYSKPGHPDHDKNHIPDLRGKIKDVSSVLDGKNYTIYATKKVTWLTALTECRRLYGELAEIPTQELVNSLSQLAKQTGEREYSFWIGATSLDEAKPFRWISNKDFNISMIDGPKDFLHRHCLLFAHMLKFPNFRPYFCNGKPRGFICQTKLRNMIVERSED